jgi:hypothetical protein
MADYFSRTTLDPNVAGKTTVSRLQEISWQDFWRSQTHSTEYLVA